MFEKLLFKTTHFTSGEGEREKSKGLYAVWNLNFLHTKKYLCVYFSMINNTLEKIKNYQSHSRMFKSSPNQWEDKHGHKRFQLSRNLRKITFFTQTCFRDDDTEPGKEKSCR